MKPKSALAALNQYESSSEDESESLQEEIVQKSIPQQHSLSLNRSKAWGKKTWKCLNNNLSIWNNSWGFGVLGFWGGRALHRKRLCSPAGLGKSLARRTRSRSRASVDCHCFAGLASRPVSRSVVNRQPTQNWHGQGESDCLIKTKHCDGQRVMLTQCDFCPVLWMSKWRDSSKRR